MDGGVILYVCTVADFYCTFVPAQGAGKPYAAIITYFNAANDTGGAGDKNAITDGWCYIFIRQDIGHCFMAFVFGFSVLQSVRFF